MEYKELKNYLKGIETPWGEIGYITYKRTYARRLNENDINSDTEEFVDTVCRVIKACKTQLKCGFTEEEEKTLGKYLMQLKGSVAGRFMWQLGTKTVNKLGLASLQNCCLCVVDEPITPFTWTMDMLMLGAGVGFNIQKENVYQIPKLARKHPKIIRQDDASADYIVPDTREGWVKLLGKTLKSYFYSGEGFTYSTLLIRGKGAPINGFGGTSSGAEVLVKGINSICEVLANRRGKKIRPIDCLDIMNIIAMVVIAGNTRRSALLSLGDCDDIEYLRAKRWDLGNIPNWRANSNNSVVCSDISELPKEFWEGYQGNGEPYGLINLDLSRSCGRLGETENKDPDVMGYNPCFTGDMYLKTMSGFATFKDIVNPENRIRLINEAGDLVDGRVWSNGTKEVVELSFLNRKPIKCTANHLFKTTEGNEVRAIDLKGCRIMPNIKGVTPYLENFYQKLGYIQGDGNLCRLASGRHLGLEVNIGADDLDIADFFGIEYKSNKRSYYVTEYNEACKNLGFDSRKLPERVFPEKYDKFRQLEKASFLNGMYSANGCVIKSNRVAYKTTSKHLAEKLETTLKKDFGISSYTTTNKPKMVDFENGTYQCRESYDVNIGKYNDIYKFYTKIGFIHEYKTTKLIDLLLKKAPYVRSVEERGEEEVFDFSLDDNLHWGIVSGAIDEVGVIAHNCAEQNLENRETCCLAEIHLPNIESKKELLDVAKILYRVNKHSLLLPCHHKDTEEVVHKNMRMGIGVTGEAVSTKEQRSWLKDTYVKLKAFDLEYSEKHGLNKSIKITTVKPSGTLSLLSGVSPGAHPAYAHYYIRRMRIASNSPLIQRCKDAGYPMEYMRGFDGVHDHGTLVVEFPCSFPEDSIFAKDISAVSQLETIKRLQSDWSDNAVSVTIYYKKEELKDIKKWLEENYSTCTKSVSFLLHSDHGFDQAPMEEITKKEYDKRVASVTPITSIDVFNENDISEDQIGCVGGVCPIK